MSDVRKSAGWVDAMSKNLDRYEPCKTKISYFYPPFQFSGSGNLLRKMLKKNRSILGFEGLVSYMRVSYMRGGGTKKRTICFCFVGPRSPIFSSLRFRFCFFRKNRNFQNFRVSFLICGFLICRWGVYSFWRKAQ